MTEGKQPVDLRDVEAWLDAAPRPVVAAWCGLDAQALQRLCQRIGVTIERQVDVRALLLDLVTWIRRQRSERQRQETREDDDDAPLLEQKLKEEIRSLRKRREWVDTRIRQIKNEFVPVADVREKMKKLSTALLRAGEQLGQRYGTDAQEAFNAALGGVLDSMTSRPASRKRPKASGKKRSSK